MRSSEGLDLNTDLVLLTNLLFSLILTDPVDDEGAEKKLREKLEGS